MEKHDKYVGLSLSLSKANKKTIESAKEFEGDCSGNFSIIINNTIISTLILF